jgi:hypothetical protein
MALYGEAIFTVSKRAGAEAGPYGCSGNRKQADVNFEISA